MLKHLFMKRFLVLVSALVLLVPVQLRAQDSGPIPVQESDNAPADGFHMAAGVSLGLMDGAGVNLSFGVTDWLKVRAGFGGIPSFLIKEYNVPQADVAVSGRFPSTGNLLLDFHPGGKSFKLTAGIFFGTSDFFKVFNTKALPESYRQAGISYYADGNRNGDITEFYTINPDNQGVVSAAIKSGAVKPFIGVGFGSAIPRKRVGVTFDLGVEYTGGLDLRADARNFVKGQVENIPITTAGAMETIRVMRNSSREESYDKYINYIDKLRSLPVLPVARVSVFVKLF